MKLHHLLFVFILCGTNSVLAQFSGIGVVSPTHTLHVVPTGTADPVRIEGLNLGSSSETHIIVVDPTTGILKTIARSSISDSQELTYNSLTNVLSLENGGTPIDLSGLAVNIYNADGILTGNRAVTQGAFDLNFDSNTLVVSGNDDRVGIGTMSPVVSLDVAGSARIAGNGTANAQGLQLTWNDANVGGAIQGISGFLNHRGLGPGGFVWSQTRDNVTFDEFMRINSAGNLGVGTSSPDARLDVEGGTVRFSDYGNNTITGSATSLLGVEADGDLVEVNTSTLSENIYNTDGTLTGNRAVAQGNFDLNFDANTLVVSGADDRVGIGTASPAVALDVIGEARFQNGNGINEFLDSQIEFGWAPNGQYRHAIKTRHNASGDNQNAFDFYVWNRGVDAPSATPSKHVLTIDGDNNGEVGIGTTNPNSELQVIGRTHTTNFTMTNGAANGRILQSDATGNASWVAPATLFTDTDTDNQSIRNLAFSGTTLTVGIEDGSSQSVSLAALSDNQSIRNLAFSGTTLTVGIEDGSSQTVSLASLRDNLGNHRLTQNLQTRNSWISTFGGAEGIFVEPGGNVGIGINNPTADLHVAGTARINSLATRSTDTYFVTADASGNLRRVSWAAAQTALGDDLGNHTATTTLLMGTQDVSFTSGEANFGATTRQMLNLWNSSYGIGVQSSTQYFRTGNHFAWYRGGGHNNGTFNAGGGVVAMTLDNTNKLNVNGEVEFDNTLRGNGKVALTTNDTWLRLNNFNQFTSGIYSPGRLRIDGGVIFNEPGGNVDLRVEGDRDVNLLRVDASSDRIGIGIGNPREKLSVRDLNNSSNFSGNQQVDISSLTFRTADFNLVTPDFNKAMGGLGLYASFSSDFDQRKLGGVYGQVGSNQSGHLIFTTLQAGVESERMTITENGNVGIATNSPFQRLHVAGNIFATGTISSSDSTLKTNIERYEIGALAQIQALNPVTYNWKASAQESGGYSNDNQIGFLAQEVKEIIPEAVSGEEGKGMGIDYNKLVPVVVKAMQEQQETIDAQQAQIDKLEAELQAIKTILKK